MKIYDSCRILSMFRFYEVLNTGDKRYLVKDYDDVEIDKELEEKLVIVWRKLFEEYITIKNDKVIRLSFKKLAHISKIETKHNICIMLLGTLSIQSTIEGRDMMVKELKSWGYMIDISKPIQDECERIKRRLNTLKSIIKIKQAEYDKEFKKEEKREKISIDEQTVRVEQIMGYTINPNKTTVSKWIHYTKEAIRISKKQKRSLTRNRM